MTTNRGFLFWPVTRRDDQSERLEYGPPAQLPLDATYEEIAIDSSDKWLASAFRLGMPNPGVWLLNLEDRTSKVHFTQGQHTTVQFSPDGKWISVGEFLSNVSVWDREKGTLVKKLCDGDQFARFSPEGKWLGVRADENRLCCTFCCSRSRAIGLMALPSLASLVCFCFCYCKTSRQQAKTARFLPGITGVKPGWVALT